MNLLPKTVKDFGSKSYWDSFFQKRKDAFEWYGEYSDLCGVLHKYSKPKDRVLVAGCGNSRLSEDLHDVGYRSMVNVDISDVVIRQMEAKNKTKRPDMQFVKMDLLDLELENQSFHVVIDKGTLDAIYATGEQKILEDVRKMFTEISRVLKTGGRYICISLAQEHILDVLLDIFPKLNWFVRVHKVEISSSESPLPVFAFVFTKTRPTTDVNLRMPQILEMVADSSEKVIRLSSTLEMKESIQAIQEYSLVKQHLKKLHPGEHFQMDLWSEESLEEPRYSLSVVDLQPSKTVTGKFAVFIVPQGREHEWLFSVEEGQKELAGSAGFQRLVVAALNRGHLYSNMEKIKKQLSGKVMELAQEGVTASVQVPFLSIGDDVGNRKQVHRGKSAHTGDYVIEDVEISGQGTFRHLIFLSNKNVVQSEARLFNEALAIPTKSSKKKKGTKKKAQKGVDFSYLACQYHHAIVAGFVFLEKMKNSSVSLLLIGLGGGSLPMFIHSHFPSILVTVVELDPDIVDVAKSWFDFQESDRMKLIVGDGIEVLKESSKSQLREGPEDNKYDIVIFHVNSKDASKALSCPPHAFVAEETVREVQSVLNSGGLFMINLVCRDRQKKEEVVDTVQQVFPRVYRIDIENEVNEVLIYKNSDINDGDLTKDGKELQQQLKSVSPSTNVDLTSFLQGLKIA